MIGEEDVAGSLVIATVHNIAWRRHVAARREEAAVAVLLTSLLDGTAEAEVWQRHGAWRRSGGAASGMRLWLWSGSAKP